MPKRKTPKGWYSDDIHWSIPNKKKPIAYSTRACSDAITACMGDMTIQEYYNKIIAGELIYDNEVVSVLKAYIDRGYGEWVCKKHFLPLDTTLPHWEKFYKGYLGDYVNPLWRCSKCKSKESEHTYNPNNPLTECPVCHIKLSYSYKTQKEMS